jgi:tRNA G10  N-methylase Trm11
LKPKIPQHRYLYSFKYDFHHTELYKLESRQIFGEEAHNKVLFSDKEVIPTVSAFIKNRLEIILSVENYADFLGRIEQENIYVEGFNVEYLILNGDETAFPERRKKAKDIGYRIEGEPDFDNPTITYAIGHFEDIWYFGTQKTHDPDWHKHKQKPCTFSNSISMTIAKTLVSLAAKGNKSNRLLDACCGVGTVMLEACCAGFNIEGCDINWKAVKHTRENLDFFNYETDVFCRDIKDHETRYAAAIIDLPYNLYSYSNDTIAQGIIESTARLTDRIVIVSIADIEEIIRNSGLKVTDFCTVEKKGKSIFTRKIWICEK